MTTIPMADTVGPSARYIPTSFSKVAGYRTGSPDVLWTPGDAQRFTTTSIVWVDQSSTLASYSHGIANVADIENGAGTFDTYVTAARARKEANLRNAVYCSIDVLTSLVSDMIKAGLLLDSTDFWVANWNLNQAEASAFVGVHKLSLDGGEYDVNVVAVQWASPTSNPDSLVPFSAPPMTLKAANIDLSETAPGWYPFDPPKPPPVVTTMTGIVVTNDMKTFRVASSDSGKHWTEF